MSKSIEELEKEVDQLKIQVDEILKRYEATRENLKNYYEKMGLKV